MARHWNWCLTLVLFAGPAVAQETKKPLYDEDQDAKVDIEKALKEAAPAKKHVLLDFGANW
jgi:hypothetical protein